MNKKNKNELKLIKAAHSNLVIFQFYWEIKISSIMVKVGQKSNYFFAFILKKYIGFRLYLENVLKICREKTVI